MQTIAQALKQSLVTKGFWKVFGVDKIHEMEQLRSLVSQLEGLAHQKQSTVSLRGGGYDGSPVKIEMVATYNVENLSVKLDDIRKRLRELDLALQRMNWEVSLVD